MPNIIINNYCNQSCSYCFAYENMRNKNLQRDMDILTYLKTLKFLKNNSEKEVRLLWWEPLLSPNIRKFLKIANKWWFNIMVFSNINIENKKIEKIFWWLNKIRINCNINDKSFYTKEEIERLWKNLEILNKLWLKIILWYNITQTKQKNNFIFNLAKEYNITAINIKITNSSLWWKLIIDNQSRKLWIYIFNVIKKYHKKFFLEFSCWLDKSIFNKIELDYIKNNTNIKLNFWCDWNIWRFDINTDWKFFKCYPLKNLFNNKKFSKLNINECLEKNINIDEIEKKVNKWLYTNWECIANKRIKEEL